LPHHRGLIKPFGQMADCTSSLLMLNTTLSARLTMLSCALLTAFCMVIPSVGSLELASSSSSSVKKTLRSERGSCSSLGLGASVSSGHAASAEASRAGAKARPSLTRPGEGKFSQANFN